MTAVTIEVGKGPLNAFQYFWAKRVTGFDPRYHCIMCLRGTKVTRIDHRLTAGGKLTFDYAGPDAVRAGDVIYLCGVAAPKRWENNFHAPFRVVEGAVIERDLWTGNKVVITNAEPIEFDGKAAREQFPNAASRYLTCRNFQFGAHMFPGSPGQPKDVPEPKRRTGAKFASLDESQGGQDK